MSGRLFYRQCIAVLSVSQSRQNSCLLTAGPPEPPVQIAPASSLLHLAADPAVMLKGSVDPRYEDNVVYLGQFKDTKHRLVEVSKLHVRAARDAPRVFRRGEPLRVGFPVSTLNSMLVCRQNSAY